MLKNPTPLLLSINALAKRLAQVTDDQETLTAVDLEELVILADLLCFAVTGKRPRKPGRVTAEEVRSLILRLQE